MSGNSVATRKPEDTTVEAILLTHGHGDHIGDTLSIAKNNTATVIAPFELAVYIQKKGYECIVLNPGESMSL